MSRPPALPRALAALAAVVALGAAAGCGPPDRPSDAVGAPQATAATAARAAVRSTTPPTLIRADTAPLRRAERATTIRLPQPYQPKPPSGGEDDYRCFLVDPQLTQPAYLTGTEFQPSNPASSTT
jgi:hypothetical protein